MQTGFRPDSAAKELKCRRPEACADTGAAVAPAPGKGQSRETRQKSEPQRRRHVFN